VNELGKDNEVIERLAKLNPAPLDEVERETAAAGERVRSRAVALVQGAATARSQPIRPLRIAVLAGLGALLLLVVGLVRGRDDVSTGDSFGSFSAIAAEQSTDGLRYVGWESRLLYDRPEYWAQGARYPDQIDDSTEVRLWIGDERRFEQDVHRYWDGTDKVTRSTYLFDPPSELLCWGGFEDMPETNCAATGLFGELGDPVKRLELPLDPEALRGALERVIRSNPEPEEPDTDCRLGGEGFGIPIPYSLIGAADRQTLLTDLRAAAGLKEDRSGWTYSPPPSERLFMTVTGLLADPEADPELRAALFEVLAGIDGARLAPDAEDRLGREASVIEYEAPPDERVAHDQVFVDPETSEILEQRTTVEEVNGSSGPKVLGTYYRLFTERSEVNELPAAAKPYERALDEAKRSCARG